jgi:CDGSH-type Zn-finger protein
MKIRIAKDGPYLVSGSVPLAVESIASDAQGGSVGYEGGRSLDAGEKYALCRCGRSETKPFCDGTHAKMRFNGTETASRARYAEQAESIEGPELMLDDAEALCAFGRFCDVGATVWTLVTQSDDPQARSQAIAEAQACPSGRLVVRDRERGAALEPELEPSIGLLEDPVKACSGPLFVKGGIELVAADGFVYEKRNRVALCRCGASQNKPFCDGSHADSGFTDGLT